MCPMDNSALNIPLIFSTKILQYYLSLSLETLSGNINVMSHEQCLLRTYARL